MIVLGHPTDHMVVRAQAEEVPDAGDARVRVRPRVVREKLAVDDRPVGPAGDDVGERPAAVDPKFPAVAHRSDYIATRGSHSAISGADMSTKIARM